MSYDGSLKFDTKVDTQGFNSGLNKINTLVKAVITGYTGKKLIDYFIGSNAEMEQYLTSFTVMLGDAEKAANLMEKITDFAAKTPLQLTDITGATQMLLNYGVAESDVMEKLQQLGDLASGDAVKLDRVSLAYGQMLAKGKVSGEELRQMTEAGVPLLQALADSMGETTAEVQTMVSAGKVGIPELNTAIESLTTGTGKFAGMMEKQSQTLTGMISTLKDNLTQFGRDVGEQAFEEVKNSISGLLEMIEKAKADGTLDEIAEEIGNALNALLTVLIKVTKFIWEYRKAIIAGVSAMIAFKTAMAVTGLLVTAVSTFQKLKKAIDAGTVAQLAFNSATNANPIMFAVSAIAALIAAIAAFVGITSIANDKTEQLGQTAVEKLEEMESAYDRQLEKLSEMETALEDNKKKIEEIQGKGTLNIADNEDIATLREINAELAIQIENERILAEIQKTALEEAALEQYAHGTPGEGETYGSDIEELQSRLGTYKILVADAERLQKLKDEYLASGYEFPKLLEDELNSTLELLTAPEYQLSNMLEDVIALQEEIGGKIVGVTEAGVEFLDAVDKFNKDINTSLGGIATSDILPEVDAEAYAAEQEKLWDNIVNKNLEQLKKRYTAQQITEAEYYAESKKILEDFSKERLGEYNSLWGNILSYEKSQGEKWVSEQEAIQNEWFSSWKSGIESMVSDSENAYNQILSAQESFKGRLFDTSDLFGFDDNDQLYLTDIAAKTAQLKDYQQLLNQLQSYEGSSGLAEYIKGLDVSSAVANLEGILSGNSQLYIDEFNDYQKAAEQIAENEYSDDLQAVKDDFVNVVGSEFLGLTDIAGEAGVSAAEAFKNGLLNSSDGVFEAVKTLLESGDIAELYSGIQGQITAEKSRTAAGMLSASTTSTTAQTQATSGNVTITVPVNIDGRQVAEAVAEYTPQLDYERGN